MSNTATFENNGDTLTFMLAGNARLTLRSQKTGTRYTYKVSAAKDSDTLYFVSLLTGSDNESDYSYLGIIRTSGDTVPQFKVTAKSRYKAESAPAAGFAYTLRHLTAGAMPPSVAISHEGRCGRCGRALTVPESIAAGIGPDCAEKMAA